MLLLNMSGTLETHKRNRLFSENGLELLIPDKRVSFLNGITNIETGSPTFTSAYFCKYVLERELIFVEMNKVKENWNG